MFYYKSQYMPFYVQLVMKHADLQSDETENNVSGRKLINTASLLCKPVTGMILL